METNPYRKSPPIYIRRNHYERERERERRERKSSLALRTALLLVAAIATLLVAISCDNKTPEPKQFTVTFDTTVPAGVSGTPSTVPSQTVSQNGKVQKPQEPTLSDYVLFHWYIDDESVPYDFDTPVTANLTLHAKWTPLVTIAFDTLAGPDKDINKVQGGAGMKVTLPLVYDTGKDFMGWKDSTGKLVPLTITCPQTDTTYTADLVTANAQFDYDDNADGLSVTVKKYNDATTPTVNIPYTHKGKLVTAIGASAFIGKSTLTNVGIPEGITSIEDAAFAMCSALKDLTIPDGVTSIGNVAFGETNLTGEITIPASVTTIGYNPFYGCQNLTSVAVAENNPEFKSANGALYSKDGKRLIGVLSGNTGDFETFVGGVTSIDNLAFWGCKNLSGTITIPEGVEILNAATFMDCSGLTGITLPSSLEKIDGQVFDGCTKLTSIEIPNSVTSISHSAFQQSGIRNITIDNTSGSINDPNNNWGAPASNPPVWLRH